MARVAHGQSGSTPVQTVPMGARRVGRLDRRARAPTQVSCTVRPLPRPPEVAPDVGQPAGGHH